MISNIVFGTALLTTLPWQRYNTTKLGHSLPHRDKLLKGFSIGIPPPLPYLYYPSQPSHVVMKHIFGSGSFTDSILSYPKTIDHSCIASLLDLLSIDACPSLLQRFLKPPFLNGNFHGGPNNTLFWQVAAYIMIFAH